MTDMPPASPSLFCIYCGEAIYYVDWRDQWFHTATRALECGWGTSSTHTGALATPRAGGGAGAPHGGVV